MAKKPNKISVKNTRINSIDLFRKILLIFLSIFIFYPPFVRGLYFEEEQFPAQILSFILLIFYLIYKYKKNDRKFFITRIDYSVVGLFIVYLLSLFTSIYLRLAISEWLKYCMYLAVYLMITDLVVEVKERLKILWIIVFSTVGISFIGIDGATGALASNFFNDVFGFFGIKGMFFDTFVDGRIFSTLQYSNAFAAFALVGFFISLILYLNYEKLSTKLVLSGLNFYIFLCFLFSQSRLVQMLFPFAFLSFVLLLPKMTKIKACIPVISSFLTTIFCLIFGLSYYFQNPVNNELKIFLISHLSILLAVGITFVIEKFIKNLIVKKGFGNFSENILNKFKNLNKKILMISALMLMIFILIILSALGNQGKEISFERKVGQGNLITTITKNINLESNKKYNLQFELNAENPYNKPNSATIEILAMNTKEIIERLQAKRLAFFEVSKTNGKELIKIDFTVPNDTKEITLNFSNYYEGTRVIFYNAKIIDTTTLKLVKQIVLNYKFLPNAIASRFENMFNSKSYLDRAVFMQDSFKILKDKYFIGSGGGAWQLLYPSYQEVRYYSTQAHTYILQLAIETGILGILVYLFFIISLFITYYKIRKLSENNKEESILATGLFVSALVIIIHSAMDFDLSLSAVFLLFIEVLAIFNIPLRLNYNTDLKSNNKIKMYLEKKFIKTKLNIKALIGIAISIVIIMFPINFLIAKSYNLNGMALVNKDDKSVAIDNLKTAIKFDSYSAKFKNDFFKAILYKDVKIEDQKAATLEIEKALNISWNNSDELFKVAQNYIRAGMFDKAFLAYDRVTELQPINIDSWSYEIRAYNVAIKYSVSDNDRKSALELVNKFNKFLNKEKYIMKNKNIVFDFDDETLKAIKEISYIESQLNLGQN